MFIFNIFFFNFEASRDLVRSQRSLRMGDSLSQIVIPSSCLASNGIPANDGVMGWDGQPLHLLSVCERIYIYIYIYCRLCQYEYGGHSTDTPSYLSTDSQ